MRNSINNEVISNPKLITTCFMPQFTKSGFLKAFYSQKSADKHKQCAKQVRRAGEIKIGALVGKPVKHIAKNKRPHNNAHAVNNGDGPLQLALLIGRYLTGGKTLQSRPGYPAKAIRDHIEVHHPPFTHKCNQNQPYSVEDKPVNNILLLSEFGHGIADKAALYSHQHHANKYAQCANAG